MAALARSYERFKISAPSRPEKDSLLSLKLAQRLQRVRPSPTVGITALATRLREAGRDVVLTEYPDAQHGFDTPLNVGAVIVSTGAQTVRGCKIREGEGGVLINVSTSQPFSYKDACVELNPHVGGNAAATAAARIAVSDFVRQLLKLE